MCLYFIVILSQILPVCWRWDLYPGVWGCDLALWGLDSWSSPEDGLELHHGTRQRRRHSTHKVREPQKSKYFILHCNQGIIFLWISWVTLTYKLTFLQTCYRASKDKIHVHCSKSPPSSKIEVISKHWLPWIKIIPQYA